MFFTDHHDTVNAMVAQGMTAREILAAFSSQSDKLQVAAILCAQPNRRELHRSHAGNWSLVVFCLLLSLSGAVSLVDTIVSGQHWMPWALYVSGTLGLVYGFVRRRLWAYAGFPIWLLYLLLNDLRGLATPKQDADLLPAIMLTFFYSLAVIFVWIAYRIRRRLYPYAGFMGPRRDKGGRLAILAALEDGTPSRAV